MLDAATVKGLAYDAGADLVGIASMDRFEGAPAQMDPRYIFPDAQAMIVMGVRILRGVLRGIEEGTHYIAYSAMGYAGINWVRMPVLLWQFCAAIEDRGFEAVPIPNIDQWSNADLHTRVQGDGGRHRPEWSRPVKPGLPAPDVFPNLRIAAFAAGLGEIGWSRLFLTPQFGPRQRLMAVLTDAPLEPDGLYDGPPICDRCKLCVTECAAEALARTESISVTVAGRDVEYAEIDYGRCIAGMTGDDGRSPFLTQLKPVYEYGNNVCGARCMRACMVHLEERGALGNQFHHPFR